MAGRRPENPVEAEDRRAAALTKAALECARLFGLNPAETATILGVQPGVLTAMKQGKRVVDGLSAEAERADAIVRIAKRLHALLGEGETKYRSWLRSHNEHFGTRPLDVMLQRDGSLKVARYLEQVRSL